MTTPLGRPRTTPGQPSQAAQVIRLGEVNLPAVTGDPGRSISTKPVVFSADGAVPTNLLLRREVFGGLESALSVLFDLASKAGVQPGTTGRIAVGWFTSASAPGIGDLCSSGLPFFVVTDGPGLTFFGSATEPKDGQTLEPGTVCLIDEYTLASMTGKIGKGEVRRVITLRFD